MTDVILFLVGYIAIGALLPRQLLFLMLWVSGDDMRTALEDSGESELIIGRRVAVAFLWGFLLCVAVADRIHKWVK